MPWERRLGRPPLGVDAIHQRLALVRMRKHGDEQLEIWVGVAGFGRRPSARRRCPPQAEAARIDLCGITARTTLFLGHARRQRGRSPLDHDRNPSSPVGRGQHAMS